MSFFLKNHTNKSIRQSKNGQHTEKSRVKFRITKFLMLVVFLLSLTINLTLPIYTISAQYGAMDQDPANSTDDTNQSWGASNTPQPTNTSASPSDETTDQTNTTSTPTNEADCVAAGGIWTNESTFGGGESLSYYCQTTTDDTVNCKSVFLGWIVCAVLTGLAEVLDGVVDNLIVPFLQSTPIDLENGESSLFKVWSTFRIIANIILVAALLFVVFGNAIGSGPAEAYLAKRSLPRIFIAAILINTSIYIAAAMVDITNILGKGIGQLLMAPFAGNGAFVFHINELTTGAPLVLSAALLAPLIATSGVIVPAIVWLLLFVALPVVFAMLAVFVTLALRQGIIMLLVIASPVAFALFALPNTAKYFSKWWDLFIKTLMVYPIVMVMIAMSNILAVMVNEANPASTASPTNLIADLASMFLMLAPVFLIPFAFKMAGGLTAQIFKFSSGLGKRGAEFIKGSPTNPDSLRSRVSREFREARVERRANLMRSVEPYTGVQRTTAAGGPRKNSRFTRRVASTAHKALSFGNVAQQQGQMANDAQKYVQSVTSTGDDSPIRAGFAERWEGKTETDGQGNVIGRVHGEYYLPYAEPDGKHKKFDYADVHNAKKLLKRSPYAMGAFLSYEMTKVGNEETQDKLSTKAMSMFNEMGFSAPQADLIWDRVKSNHVNFRPEQRWRDVVEEVVTEPVVGPNGQVMVDEDGNTITKTRKTGKLTWGETNHARQSAYLAQNASAWNFSSLRDSAPKNWEDGFKEAWRRINVEGAEKNSPTYKYDRQIVDNYTKVAKQVGTLMRLDGSNRSADPSMMSAGGEGNPAEGQTVRGIGAAARTEVALRDFYKAVNEARGGLNKFGPDGQELPPQSPPAGPTTPPPAGPSGPTGPTTPPAGSSPPPNNPPSPPPTPPTGPSVAIPPLQPSAGDSIRNPALDDFRDWARGLNNNPTNPTTSPNPASNMANPINAPDFRTIDRTHQPPQPTSQTPGAAPDSVRGPGVDAYREWVRSRDNDRPE